MQLPVQSFTTLVQNFAAGVQSSATALVDFTVGSILRAVGEATASVGLWLQYLILQVMALTRAATSTGSDLDTWMADYGVTRLPAVAATGQVTFSRATPTQAAFIPVGATVITTDLTVTFAVVADTTNPAYSAAQGGYTLAANVSSINIEVQCATTGASGNVLAGAITLLGSGIPGVDTVSNAAPFTNGENAETDAELRARFQNFLNTRALGTPLAVGYAISGVQQGLDYTIQENVTPNGTAQPGTFVVTVDDGSGDPPASLISAITTAVQNVRPIGSVFTVQAPTITQVTVTLTITTNPTSNKTGLLAPVQNAVLAYINALPIGQTLPYSKIGAVAYAVDPSIINVSAVLLNGGTADITVTQSGVVKSSSVTVS